MEAFRRGLAIPSGFTESADDPRWGLAVVEDQVNVGGAARWLCAGSSSSLGASRSQRCIRRADYETVKTLEDAPGERDFGERRVLLQIRGEDRAVTPKELGHIVHLAARVHEGGLGTLTHEHRSNPVIEPMASLPVVIVSGVEGNCPSTSRRMSAQVCVQSCAVAKAAFCAPPLCWYPPLNGAVSEPVRRRCAPSAKFRCTERRRRWHWPDSPQGILRTGHSHSAETPPRSRV